MFFFILFFISLLLWTLTTQKWQTAIGIEPCHQHGIKKSVCSAICVLHLCGGETAWLGNRSSSCGSLFDKLLLTCIQTQVFPVYFWMGRGKFHCPQLLFCYCVFQWFLNFFCRYKYCLWMVIPVCFNCQYTLSSALSICTTECKSLKMCVFISIFKQYHVCCDGYDSLWFQMWSDNTSYELVQFSTSRPLSRNYTVRIHDCVRVRVT